MTVKAQAYSSIITELGEVFIPDDASTEGMISAGHYSYVNKEISSAHFPITCRGTRKLFLMQLRREVEVNKVQNEVSSLGNKQLALIGDLLALGAHPVYREVLQSTLLIICLGFTYTVRDSSRAPFLFRRGEELGLDLKYFYDRCRIDDRVLLVDSPLPGK